jgi:DedD protein
MAIQATSEEQLKFKKRARQRLIGAGALLLTAAIVLPLVLDATPRQQNTDVVIDMVNPTATKLTEPVLPIVPAKTEAAISSIVDATATPSTTPKDRSENKLADINSISEKTANDVVQPAELKANETPKVEKNIESKSEPRPEPKVATKPDVKAEVKEVTKPKQEIKKPEVKVEAKAAVKVEPKVVAKAEPKSSIETSSDKTPVSTQHFVVQLGAFSNAENVQQLRDRLTAVGVVTYTEKLPSGATRVRVGPYADKAQADKVLAKVNAAGVQAQVVPLK